jgi:hypothetical protein
MNRNDSIDRRGADEGTEHGHEYLAGCDCDVCYEFARAEIERLITLAQGATPEARFTAVQGNWQGAGWYAPDRNLEVGWLDAGFGGSGKRPRFDAEDGAFINIDAAVWVEAK